MLRAARRIVDEGREAAARILEAAAADIGYAGGRFTVLGTDRSIGLFELAAEAPRAATEGIATRLHAHPNGAAGCEVEIDPETGALSVIRYATVDDVGRVGRVALEIAVHEENEARLLSMEVAELEAHWRREEELARIMDGELTFLRIRGRQGGRSKPTP